MIVSPSPTGAEIDLHSVDQAARETLDFMVAKGIPKSTLRAIASDMRYLEAWSMITSGACLEWPAYEATQTRFLAHHLFDASQRKRDPGHGMPSAIESSLRDVGYLKGRMPPALSTIERRISSWSKMHALRDMVSPFSSPRIRHTRKTMTAAFNGARQRKSPQPITMKEVTAAMETCTSPDYAIDLRDKALIGIMYASGGRRRSEPGNIRVADIAFAHLPSDPGDPMSEAVLAVRISMPRTKTTRAGDAEVWAAGPPAEALKDWLNHLGHQPGSDAFVFPRIYNRRVRHNIHGIVNRFDVDKWGPGLSGEGVRDIFRKRLTLAGLDPREFTPHGIRAGFLTDAQRSGVLLGDAMQQSLHKSEKQAMSYYSSSAVTGKAARLLVR